MKKFPLMLIGEWFKLDNLEYIWLGDNEALQISSNKVHALECNSSFTRTVSPDMKRVSFWLDLQRQKDGGNSELIRRLEYPTYITVKDVRAGQRFQYNGVIFIGLEQAIEQDSIKLKVINNSHKLCELYATDVVELI
jgi:hypothetical protein